MSACACGCGTEANPGRRYIKGHNRRKLYGRPLTRTSRRNAQRRAAESTNDLFPPSVWIAGRSDNWDDPYARIGLVFVPEPPLLDPSRTIVYAHRCDHTPPVRLPDLSAFERALLERAPCPSVIKKQRAVERRRDLARRRGRWIRATRKACGLTLRDVADAVGTSTACLHNWEHGVVPHKRTRPVVARVLWTLRHIDEAVA